MKAWTKRLKAQYSSSFSSYHCCQELQKWAPPAQDHDCLLPWQLCTNPSIWTQGTEPKHTPFPHWEFFTQQSWIGKSCPIKDLKKKMRKKGAVIMFIMTSANIFHWLWGFVWFPPPCPMPPVERYGHLENPGCPGWNLRCWDSLWLQLLLYKHQNKSSNPSNLTLSKRVLELPLNPWDIQ